MSAACIAAAVRSPVAIRGGRLSHLQAWQLASPLIHAILQSTAVAPGDISHVLMGNALYGGGNPARMAALHAGLPESVPALTLDSQCCGGMDAIALAAQMIRSGSAHMIIAGGLESWSRAPQRISNPVTGAANAYNRPPFSPWPDRDPEMLVAAAELAQARSIDTAQQQQYAIESHAKALAQPEQPGLIPLGELANDEFSRVLTKRLCERLPVVAGKRPFALDAASVAAEGDAAALTLLVSEQAMEKYPLLRAAIQVRDSRSGGASPEQPALAPIVVAKQLLNAQTLDADQLHSVHLMEAFAVQAMVFIEDLGLDARRCNPSGGALSRGHPIGASGAIEVVNAYHSLQSAPQASLALCAIAAAGGLGSALLLERA